MEIILIKREKSVHVIKDIKQCKELMLVPSKHLNCLFGDKIRLHPSACLLPKLKPRDTTCWGHSDIHFHEFPNGLRSRFSALQWPHQINAWGLTVSAIREKLLLSKRRCEFRVLVTPGGDAGIGSTERRLLRLVLLWGHKQKHGTVSHTSNLEPSLL